MPSRRITKRQQRILDEHEKDPTASIVVKAQRAGVSYRHCQRTLKKFGIKTVQPQAAPTPTANKASVMHVTTDLLGLLSDKTRQQSEENISEEDRLANERKDLARNSTNPEEINQLVEQLIGEDNSLAKDKLVEAVLKNQATSSDALNELCQGAILNRYNRKLALELPDISAEAIHSIITRCYWWRRNVNLRTTVAKHPKTGPDTLERQADDENSEVRKLVAVHPNTPDEAVDRLSNDYDPEVRIEVAKRPSKSDGRLARQSKDPDSRVRREVARNKSASSDTLDESAKDKDPRVRAAVAKNSAAANKTLHRLRNDPHPSVRGKAAQRLRMREAGNPNW